MKLGKIILLGSVLSLSLFANTIENVSAEDVWVFSTDNGRHIDYYVDRDSISGFKTADIRADVKIVANGKHINTDTYHFFHDQYIWFYTLNEGTAKGHANKASSSPIAESVLNVVREKGHYNF